MQTLNDAKETPAAMLIAKVTRVAGNNVDADSTLTIALKEPETQHAQVLRPTALESLNSLRLEKNAGDSESWTTAIGWRNGLYQGQTVLLHPKEVADATTVDLYTGSVKGCELPQAAFLRCECNGTDTWFGKVFGALYECPAGTCRRDILNITKPGRENWK